MRLVWNLIEFFKSYSFRRQFADVNSQHFLCNFAGSIGWYYGNFPVNYGELWLRTSKIINEISVKFDWVFLRVIHLDVNLDVNSQPFSM